MDILLFPLRCCLHGSLIETVESPTTEDVELLEKMDNFTLSLVTRVPESIIEGEDYTDEALATHEVDLGWRKTGKDQSVWGKDSVKVQTVHIGRKLKILMHDEDDFFGKPNGLLTRILRSPIPFPLKDRYDLVGDKAALSLVSTLKLAPRGPPPQASPQPYHAWPEMTSDEAISRIFFYGIGSVLVASQSTSAENKFAAFGPFVVDLDLSKLKVRKGFSAYGARAHFDQNQRLTAIYNYAEKRLVKPSDRQAWERAKHILKQTTLILITAREHLLWTHMLLSNTITRIKTEILPPTHPIRRLLTVFTFRTNYVNNSAEDSLLPKLSIIHRSTAFEFGSLVKLFEDGHRQSNIFEPFVERPVAPAVEKLSQAGKFPYLAEGRAWFHVVEIFVLDWLEKAGEDAMDDLAENFYSKVAQATKGQSYEVPLPFSKVNLVKLLTQVIWTVTAYHEMVGTIVDYTEKPSFMGFRALADENSTTTDLQSYLILSILTAATAIRMPDLVGQFENLFGAGGAPHWERDCWDRFQQNIQKQSRLVRKADSQRAIEFKNMDPSRFECSVSI